MRSAALPPILPNANGLQLALQENEQRWMFAIEGMGDGLWDWDISAGTIFFSKRWKEMLGFAGRQWSG